MAAPPCSVRRRWSGRRRFRFARANARLALAHDAPFHPGERIVELGYHALLERDDRVVGDVDVLGADLGAALRDVAVTEALLRADELEAIVRVERMHLKGSEPHEVARAAEALLVLLMVPHDVADVLAEEALDALVELLDAVDVLLVHPAFPVGILGLGPERWDGLRLLVVEGHVGDQILDHREGLDRGDRDDLARRERVHPGHAHEPGVTVDLGAARAALAGLAVPADGEAGRGLRLDPMHDVEDDHPLVGLDGVVLERALRGAAPDAQGYFAHPLRGRSPLRPPFMTWLARPRPAPAAPAPSPRPRAAAAPPEARAAARCRDRCARRACA